MPNSKNSFSSARRRMHVLFAMPHTGYLRNFESGVAALLDRGHHVTLGVGKLLRESQPILDRLRNRGDISIDRFRRADDAQGGTLGRSLRGTIDYWHYLHPRFEATPALTERARADAPRGARWFERTPSAIRSLLRSGAHQVERRLRVPEALVTFLRDRAPDVLLLTPLIYLQSSQVLWVRAARRLRIPTVFAVHSWDNLTTKGTFHEVPDRVLLWNEAQRTEAVEQHGIEPARCIVTGAVAYDHWFTTQPTRARDAFVRDLGLPAGRAVVLYLCSSRFIARNETAWVEEWLRALRRAADPRLRDAVVIIRPHPQNGTSWHHWMPGDPAVCVFPRRGENPVSDEARLTYLHSLLHCDAVVGINTSALIEAAILGRPVLTVLTPQHAGKQRDTLHFGHLEQGLLSVASDTDAHTAQLAAAVAGEANGRRSRQFVKQFVRPLGLDRPAGVEMAEALEALIPARHDDGARVYAGELHESRHVRN